MKLFGRLPKTVDIATLSVLLTARDQLSGPLGKMQGTLNSVAQKARTAGLAFTAIGGVLAGIGALAVKAASDIEESVNAVTANAAHARLSTQDTKDKYRWF